MVHTQAQHIMHAILTVTPAIDASSIVSDMLFSLFIFSNITELDCMLFNVLIAFCIIDIFVCYAC